MLPARPSSPTSPRESRGQRFGHWFSKLGRRGTASVELAVCLPVLITVLLGTLEVGRLVQVQQIMTNAAREGGRQAASGQMTATQVQQAITTYVSSSGLPTSQLTISVSNVTSPGVSPDDATYMSTLNVIVSIPFQQVRFCDALLTTTNSTLVTGTATWYSGNSQAYPNSISVPSGY